MTAIETVMLMHLALLAGDKSLTYEARSSYLSDATSWYSYLDRMRRIRVALKEMGVVWP